MKYENAIHFYQLHTPPPHIITHLEGRVFKTLMNGRTSLVISGLEIPAPGCPCPERLVFAQVLIWLHRNRLWWPIIPVVALALFALQALLLTLPELSEMKLAFVGSFSTIVNLILVVLLGFGVIAVCLYNFGKGVHVQFNFEGDKPVQLLDAGEITLHPDTLVKSEGPEESPDEFALRLESARVAQRPGEWIVAIPFRHPGAVIIFNTEPDEEAAQGSFLRDEPPYQGIDWPENELIVRPGKRFSAETWEEYQSYLCRFTAHFPEWSKFAKTKAGDPAQAMANTLRRMANTLLFVLIAMSGIFAQKDAQVHKYLGDVRYNTDKPTGEVAFVFKKAVIKRMGNGQRTYKELLPDAQFYTNEDNAGRLVGITVGKAVIFPESPTKTTASKPASITPVETLPNTDAGNGNTFWESMPDSSELEGMKASFIAEKSKFGRELAPRKDFLAWMYWQTLAPIMLLIGLIAFYIAKSAFAEAIHDTNGNTLFGRDIAWWGHRARYVVFFVVALNCVVIMVDMAISDYFTSSSLWWWLIKSTALVLFAYWITKTIVPNPKVVTSRFTQTTNDLPRLNR